MECSSSSEKVKKMDKLNEKRAKILLETYKYVYLTELDHRENINDIVRSHDGASKFEDISYFPMWERSKKALDNLEDYLRLVLDEIDGDSTLRSEFEELKVINILEGIENHYLDRIIKLQ